MKTHFLLILTACGGALSMAAGARAFPVAAGSDDGAKAVEAVPLVAMPVPVPPEPLHPVPPVVAPSNCADGFAQTWVNGEAGSKQFGFGCQSQIACPPGTEYLQSIQIASVQTGPTTATFTYSCSYLAVSTQRK